MTADTELNTTEETIALKDEVERLRRILKGSNDGVWEWGPRKGIYYYSPRVFEQLGYDAETFDFKPGTAQWVEWRSWILDEDKPRWDEAIRAHVSGKAPLDIDYRIFNAHGKLVWLRSRAYAIRNERGEVEVLSGANTDITTLKEQEQEIRLAKEAAEKANQAKTLFLSRVSHELRTPMNAILSFSRFLAQDSGLFEKQRNNALEIHRAAEHLLTLVNDLLDLGKIETGNLPLKMEPVSLTTTVTRCLTLLQDKLHDQKIQLHQELPESVWVHADLTRLTQVVLNILDNGIKYNRYQGELNINMMVENNRVLLSIADTGNGIAESQMPHLFEPFHRLGAEDSDIQGTGIGLAVCKQLVDAMGGTIECRSQVGEGTRFTLFFQHLDVVPEQAIKPEAITSTELSFPGKRVLYVEDNLANQKVLSQLCEQFDLDVALAGDGRRGLYLARLLQPDLIVLDIHLPDLSGYEILQLLQFEPCTAAIPVIGLSASASAEDISDGLAKGFAAYLTKPIEFEAWGECLERLLNPAEEIRSTG